MKRINKNLLIRPAFFTAVVLCSAVLGAAQSPKPDEYPKFEIFAGYSGLGENQKPISINGIIVPHGYAAPAGVETSLIRNFSRYVGLKADFSAHFNDETGPGNVIVCNPACTTAPQAVQFRSRVYNFLAGPELKARNHTRFTPFAHVLGGVAHTSANFTTPGPTFNLSLEKSDNSFAMALGGGLDIRASKRVSFRGMMDYNPVFANDSTGGRRDFIRLSLGILFH